MLHNWLSFVEVNSGGMVVLLDKESDEIRMLKPTKRFAKRGDVSKKYINCEGNIEEGDSYLYCRAYKDKQYFNVYVKDTVNNQKSEKLKPQHNWKDLLCVVTGSFLGSALVNVLVNIL